MRWGFVRWEGVVAEEDAGDVEGGALGVHRARESVGPLFSRRGWNPLD